MKAALLFYSDVFQFAFAQLYANISWNSNNIEYLTYWRSSDTDVIRIM